MPQIDAFNAFISVCDTTQPTSGLPLSNCGLAVKDIFDVAGIKSGWGNPQRYAESQPARRTMPAVQALLDAGAHVIGKTQTDELAFSLTGHNAHYPQPINPNAPERVTGGSSSGSAAAVAGALADIAVGSDTGGSIRAPASFCSLIGLRTTQGAISLEGAMPLAPSLDTFGWFARDMDIYQRVTDVFFAPDPRRPSKLLRIESLESLLLGPCEQAAYRQIENRVGEALVPISTAPGFSHHIDDLYWCFRKIQGYEAWQSHGAWISSAERGLGPGVKERFEFGATITLDDVRTQTATRNAFRHELAQLLGDDGFLVMPTVPGAAPLRSTSFDELQTYREQALRLLCISGLSGFPQISLPLGTVDGSPFGISLIGPAGSDAMLVACARSLLEIS